MQHRNKKQDKMKKGTTTALPYSELLKDKVAIITGAGNGLGLAYAHALASQGCRIVVNDIGVSSPHGNDSATTKHQQHQEHVADRVAYELNKHYGCSLYLESSKTSLLAVANRSPVSEERAHEILETAIETFGRVDILINNAGIVRDRVYEKTTEQDWRLLMQVHLGGVFKLSQLVYAQFKKQHQKQQLKLQEQQLQHQQQQQQERTNNNSNFYASGGKILFVSSVAIYGSFGQVAYASLKSAMIGLCHSLAKEINSRKLPFCVNTIMPLADSRILRTSNLPEYVYEMLKVESILPAIVYLVSPLCRENGGIFEIAGGYIYRVNIQRGKPVQFKSIQDLHTQWTQLGTKTFGSSDEAVGDLLNTISSSASANVSNKNNNSQQPEKDQQQKRTNTTSKMSDTTTTTDLPTLFEAIKKNIAAMPKDEPLPQKRFIYVLSNNKKYLLDLKERSLVQLDEGNTTEKADVTITMNDEDFIKLMTGESKPQQLFFAKKLKIAGDLGLAMKMIGLREKLVNGPGGNLTSKL